jgi:hypothetical protein
MHRYPAFALLCAALVLAACGTANAPSDGGDGASPTSGTPSVAPEEALRLFVQRRLNQGFVADCDNAQRPDDVGKQCARLRGERNGLLAYELGPTFSEYTRLIILQRVGDSWTIAHQENRDPDQPPVPGIPWPIELRANLVVAGTAPDCLRVRERPGLRAPELTCIDDGIAVTVESGPVEIDGYEWWQLEGYDGWVAGNWLRYPDEAATPAPTAPPAE